MAYQLKDYKVDYSTLTDRDQLGNALLWSLEQFRELASRKSSHVWSPNIYYVPDFVCYGRDGERYISIKASTNKDPVTEPIYWEKYSSNQETEQTPVYQQVLEAFVAEANELYVAITDLAKRRTVAYADGVWLDGIGRIVGQPRETVPQKVPDQFFYWDDYGGSAETGAHPDDPHYFDTFQNWVSFAGDEAVATGAPDDGQYRQQIIRRIYQNANRNSSYAEVRAVAMDLLDLPDLWISHTNGSAGTELNIRTIKFWVPDNTPTWKKDFLVGKSYGVPNKPWNKWYLPLPACVQVDSTVGLISAW